MSRTNTLLVNTHHSLLLGRRQAGHYAAGRQLARALLLHLRRLGGLAVPLQQVLLLLLLLWMHMLLLRLVAVLVLVLLVHVLRRGPRERLVVLRRLRCCMLGRRRCGRRSRGRRPRPAH